MAAGYAGAFLEEARQGFGLFASDSSLDADADANADFGREPRSNLVDGMSCESESDSLDNSSGKCEAQGASHEGSIANAYDAGHPMYRSHGVSGAHSLMETSQNKPSLEVKVAGEEPSSEDDKVLSKAESIIDSVADNVDSFESYVKDVHLGRQRHAKGATHAY